jgi:hypothetical protein
MQNSNFLGMHVIPFMSSFSCAAQAALCAVRRNPVGLDEPER